MKTNRSQKPGGAAVGRNPLQDTATKNQTPRWSKKQGKPGKEAIPPQFSVRSRKPKDTLRPPGGEVAEPITGPETGSYEDEPSI